MRKTDLLLIIIIVLSFAVSAYFYPQLPKKEASRWIVGSEDDDSDKAWIMFLIPSLSVLLMVLLILIPRVDPLKENIQEFRRHYDGFLIMIMLFLFYVHVLVILENMKVEFHMIQVLAPAFAVLYYYFGILIENSKRNWFIGIGTPWTLTDEKVWDATHKHGGKLLKVAGGIALLGVLLPDYAIYLIVAPIILVILYIFIFSYFEYHKKGRRGRRKRKI